MFPAPAGINRILPKVDLPQERVPRASGDKPPFMVAPELVQECSPRQRG
ncbi:hypothetical protein IOY67_000014 [Salmonella enterica]|nr:hypothetical protein [Salmonella enterica]